MSPSRRAVLAHVGAVGLGTTVFGTASAQDSQILRDVVVPRIEVFEGNYVGQWIEINERTDVEETADINLDVVDDCSFPSWTADETQAYRGQLLDRRSEAPVAVDVVALANGTQPAITPDTVFIINRTVPCTDEYIGLRIESVPRRSVVGKPPGPTVTETDNPGFGAVGAIVAILAGLVAWVRHRSNP